MRDEQRMLSEAALKAEIQRLEKTRQLASFDFAIKFLLKDKSSHETISGVLTTLLTLAGYSPVKITCFEDPESNIEHPGQKRSVVDLQLRGSQGDIYLMEVQRLTSYKVHRKCIFSTSRATVDHIPVGAAYDKLNKVFHISILYFIPDYMTEDISHQKASHIYLRSKKPLHLEPTCYYEVKKDIEIYPESFLISVPLFDGMIRSEGPKEWIHLSELMSFLQTSEIKDDFTAPYMKRRFYSSVYEGT